MSSSSVLRALAAQRSSVLRTQTKRQATLRMGAASSRWRRGYASVHDIAAKTSDTPWLLGAVGVTVVGLAYLESGRATGSGAHGPQSADAIASHREEAAHGKLSSSSSSDSKPESEPEPQQSGADKPEGAAEGAAEQGEAPSSKEEVSQPSADGADAATKSEEEKKKKKGEGNEESETTTSAGEEEGGKKAATTTSSSTTPGKKTAEDAREDSKKGEDKDKGETEAGKKGSSKKN
ncbi:hypothetical protein F4824DRAFT_500256 [Ustulina deusta]|nr:hypothetical protein F4824DRAFT_500256 [Ustulina deusta]